MAILFTTNPLLDDIVSAVEKLSEEEQRQLLAQINADYILKNRKKFKLVAKPAKVSMKQIDKWKHEARKYAK